MVKISSESRVQWNLKKVKDLQRQIILERRLKIYEICGISEDYAKSTLIRKHLVAFVKKNDADAGWTVYRSLGPPETC